MVENELAKIADLFHTKLDSFYGRTEFIDRLKVEPIDEPLSYVTPQDSELCTDKVVAPTSIGIKEK